MDDRLLREPTEHSQKRWQQASISTKQLLRVLALIVSAHLLGVLDFLCAVLTAVQCSPAIVIAGANVTCEITTGTLSSDADLSITQLGVAGVISLLNEDAHLYRVSFTTQASGRAGLVVSHMLFWSTSTVEVLAGPAITVDVACAPHAVGLGSKVQCAVKPRDALGNMAEVSRPSDSSDSYFSVGALGSAHDLEVHDTYVSFIAGASGNAGIRVMLNGHRFESGVVVADSAAPETQRVVPAT